MASHNNVVLGSDCHKVLGFVSLDGERAEPLAFNQLPFRFVSFRLEGLLSPTYNLAGTKPLQLKNGKIRPKAMFLEVVEQTYIQK